MLDNSHGHRDISLTKFRYQPVDLHVTLLPRVTAPCPLASVIHSWLWNDLTIAGEVT